MALPLDGKVALVTGAASGIGAASAKLLSVHGARVMCADIDVDGAAATALAINQEQGTAEHLEVNTADENSVVDALDRTEKAFGQVDVVFNNAGIAGGEWDRTIGINLSGVYYGLKHSAPRMAKRGGGVILNTASVAGLVGLHGPQGDQVPDLDAIEMGGISSYVSAKHGVSGLTKQFAIVYGRFNVRVNAIAPGYIETPMTASIREQDISQANTWRTCILLVVTVNLKKSHLLPPSSLAMPQVLLQGSYYL